MKYLPSLHTSTVIFFSILAILSFYHSGKAEQKQNIKNEVNAIFAQACMQSLLNIEPATETKSLITKIKKLKVRIYKTPMEAFEDNDFSKTIDKALNNKK